jgi:SAM-dependent methyltransferase
METNKYNHIQFRCPSDDGRLVQKNGDLTCPLCGKAYPVYSRQQTQIVDLRENKGGSCSSHLGYPHCMTQANSYGGDLCCHYDLAQGLKNLPLSRPPEPLPSTRPDIKAQWMLNHIGKNNLILDIGIREGPFGPVLAQDNYLMGMDICARAMLFGSSNALGKGYRILILGNALHLPFAQELDVIVATEILEHIVHTQHALKSFYRALKPGGIVLLTVPNAFSLWLRLSYIWGSGKGWTPYPILTRKGKISNPGTSLVYPDQKIHLRFFSFASLRKLLQEEGFQILDEYGIEAGFLHRNPTLEWITQKSKSFTSNIAFAAQKSS